MIKRWIGVTGLALIAIAQTCEIHAASSWRVFRAGDGLGQSACVSVFVNAQGRVLVGHAAGTVGSELDGYAVTNFPVPANAFARIAASPSRQVWSMSSAGLLELRDQAWMLHSVTDIAAALRDGRNSRTGGLPFLPIRQGHVLVLLHDRLIEVNAEKPGAPEITTWKSSDTAEIGAFRRMSAAPDGGLWVTGSRGVARIIGPLRTAGSDLPWRNYPLPPGSAVTNLSEPMPSGSDGVTTVGDQIQGSGRIIAHFDGAEWRFHEAGISNALLSWHGPEHRRWAMSSDSLAVSVSGDITTEVNEQLSVRRFYDAALDAAGSFWLATSDGLFRYAPPCWRAPAELATLDAPVLALAESEDAVWFVSPNSLFSLGEGGLRQHQLPVQLERSLQDECALYPFRDGRVILVIGTRVFRFGAGGWETVELSAERRVLGALRDNSVCLWRKNSDLAGALEIFDGNRFESWMALPETITKIGRLLTIYQSRSGTIWLGGETGVARFHDRKWETFTSEDRTTPENGVAFIELADDRIWSASQDRIWEFDGRNWIVVRPGFDRINGMARSRDGSVWVASHSGVWRWWQNAWIENNVDDGLGASSVVAIRETADGRIWAATAGGLDLYHPGADPDPPRTEIRKLTTEETIPEGGTLNLLFSGRDKWKFTAPGRLLYSYRLDQHDWSPFQELNAVSFPDLAPGKHYFQVRAMDRNGNIEASPAQLEFAVALPWYRETRLVLATVLGLAAALFFAGIAWNRHRRLLRSYAEVERQVAERTRQLEQASRELSHSQKMNALGTLAAGVAHDFNNILSIVRGSAQIIEDNVDNPQKVRTRVDRIKTVVEQGSGIVKAMLGFSRDTDSQAQSCDPNDVVRDTIRLLGDRFLRQTDVQFEPAPHVPEVIASRNFIQQVLLNFIFNAAEAAVDDRRVVVRTGGSMTLPDGMVLAPRPAQSYVLFRVQDFGCGIAPENLPRIFEPFFTTKSMSARRGTGLGLSMVYELVKRMGGGLAVKTEVGKGSTFTLVLPAGLSSDPQAAPSLSGAPEDRKTGIAMRDEKA